MLMRVSGTALRKIRKFFGLLAGVCPSHEIVRQWTDEVGRDYQKSRTVTVGSGIYNYDEQYLRIKGVSQNF